MLCTLAGADDRDKMEVMIMMIKLTCTVAFRLDSFNLSSGSPEQLIVTGYATARRWRYHHLMGYWESASGRNQKNAPQGTETGSNSQKNSPVVNPIAVRVMNIAPVGRHPSRKTIARICRLSKRRRRHKF
jgi:hypothetical protein